MRAFLADRLDEGRGGRRALMTDQGDLTYAEVDQLARRFATVLSQAGVGLEQRVIVALPDRAEFVGALFGTLQIGATVVMVNCHLKADAIRYFYEYTRARVVIVHADHLAEFEAALADAKHRPELLVLGGGGAARIDERLASAEPRAEIFDSHRDDAAIWLFSGGTTGRPKAVVQTHGSFLNTTELYAVRTLGMTEDDVTLSVPKLYFGYATGSNLLFPFYVGGAAVLFEGRSTPGALYDRIKKHRPTVLINVPTMINKMLADARASTADLSCLRFATSAGEALPVELYERWKTAFGVELLDGAGDRGDVARFRHESPR